MLGIVCWGKKKKKFKKKFIGLTREKCLQEAEAIDCLICLCGKDGQSEVELGMNP